MPLPRSGGPGARGVLVAGFRGACKRRRRREPFSSGSTLNGACREAGWAKLLPRRLTLRPASMRRWDRIQLLGVCSRARAFSDRRLAELAQDGVALLGTMRCSRTVFIPKASLAPAGEIPGQRRLCSVH